MGGRAIYNWENPLATGKEICWRLRGCEAALLILTQFETSRKPKNGGLLTCFDDQRLGENVKHAAYEYVRAFFSYISILVRGESGCNVNRDEFKESKNHVRSLVENKNVLSWQHSSLDYVHVAKTLSNTEC